MTFNEWLFIFEPKTGLRSVQRTFCFLFATANGLRVERSLLSCFRSANVHCEQSFSRANRANVQQNVRCIRWTERSPDRAPSVESSSTNISDSFLSSRTNVSHNNNGYGDGRARPRVLDSGNGARGWLTLGRVSPVRLVVKKGYVWGMGNRVSTPDSAKQKR